MPLVNTVYYKLPIGGIHLVLCCIHYMRTELTHYKHCLGYYCYCFSIDMLHEIFCYAAVFQLVWWYSDKFQSRSSGLDQFHSWTQTGDGQGSGKVPGEASRRQVEWHCAVTFLLINLQWHNSDDVFVPVRTVWARARLRSANHGDMVIPRSCTVRFGQRSFRSSAPSVWNDLPSELKNSDISRQGFKSSLKSWLFECAYL